MKRFRFILLLLLLCCNRLPAQAEGSDAVSGTTEFTDTIEQEREKQKQEIIVKVVDNRIHVEHIQKEMILEIYNIMGIKVYNRRIPPGNGEYPVNLSKGYYILKIGRTTKKVAIR